MPVLARLARFIKEKLKKYFSGRLVIIQITAGVGAFAGRSLAAYFTHGQDTWVIVVTSQIGSFGGYISTWVLGYWLAFRADYRVSGRSMPWDVFRLELVEQMPSIAMVVPSSLAQAALIESELMGTERVSDVVSVNLGSWFGPHRIVNVVFMLTSNSLKKAWVDGTWSPLALLRRMKNRIKSAVSKD